MYVFLIYTERLSQKLMFHRSQNQLAECKLQILIFFILQSLGYPEIRQCSYKLVTRVEKN